MSASQKLRWGILGTGWIVRKYAEAARLTRDMELVAIASREADRARATAATHGIPRAHAGYDALLADPAVDVVINALHNGLHCEWTCRALAAGKHVLCEKPLACTSAEVDQMFAAAHANHRWLLEGFMYRFHPHIAEALRRVAAGEIGRVLHVRSARVAPGRDRNNPRYRREAGGGALLDIGCYCVNLSRACTGAEPTRVTAQARFDAETDVDLTLSGTLEFLGGAIAQFVCSFEGEPTYSAEVIGTEGRLTIPHPWMPPFFPNVIELTRRTRTETITVAPPDVPRHVLAPFVLEFDHFCVCIRDNRPPEFPPGHAAERDTRGNMRAIDALLASARQHRPVEF